MYYFSTDYSASRYLLLSNEQPRSWRDAQECVSRPLCQTNKWQAHLKNQLQSRPPVSLPAC